MFAIMFGSATVLLAILLSRASELPVLD